MLKAVLLDLDGVITDTAAYHYLAWKELASEIGIEIDPEFNEQLKGVSRMESLNRILRHGGKMHAFTPEEKLELAARKNARYVQLLEGVTPADIYPGVERLLVELREAGVYAVLASASKNAPQILSSLRLTEYFDYIVDPDEIAYGKPAPDMFLRGAEAVGAPAAVCIGIEDAEAGVEAIKAAGMIAVGIGADALLGAAGADVVLPTTEALSLTFLRSLL